jgi:hypothetical protein
MTKKKRQFDFALRPRFSRKTNPCVFRAMHMEFYTVRIRGRRIVHDSVIDGHYCKAELDDTQAYVEEESHTIYHTACQGIFGARF